MNAAKILGMSERTFRRYCRDHEACGAEGRYDARLDRIASNAAQQTKCWRCSVYELPQKVVYRV